MQRAGRLTIVTVAVLASLLMAIPPVAADPGKQPRIDTLLQRRLHDPRLGSNVAMIVIDADTGGVLSKHSADRPMHTASNMKIVCLLTPAALASCAWLIRLSSCRAAASWSGVNGSFFS